MRRKLISTLLRVLNSGWLNQTPCRYEFVGNIDAFSREHIESSLRQAPGITLREFLDAANQFKMCPLKKDGLMVIEDGEFREGTIWDIHDLKQSLLTSSATPPPPGDGK